MFLSTENNRPNTKEEHRELDRKLNMHVGMLQLSPRIANILSGENIHRIKQLLDQTPEDLLGEVQNFGETALAETYRKLQEIGFYRKGHEPLDQLEMTLESNRQLEAEESLDLGRDDKNANGRSKRTSHMSQSQRSMELTLKELLAGKMGE